MPRLFDLASNNLPVTAATSKNRFNEMVLPITPSILSPQEQYCFGENYGSSEPTALRRQPMNIIGPAVQNQVFGSICGRLTCLGETKKYDITVGEISRRVSAPENLNSSFLGGLLRFGKRKENTDILRNDLAQYGLILELGKRKTNRANGFTMLCEGEARELAVNFTDLCLGHGGADCIGRAYAEELLKEGENTEETLKTIVAMKKFLSFLTKVHHGDSYPAELPYRTPVDNAVNHLSLRTHGFSHVAMSGVADYMKQMMGSAMKTLCRRDAGTRPISSNVSGSASGVQVPSMNHQISPMQSQSPIFSQSPVSAAASPNVLSRTTSQSLPDRTPVSRATGPRLPIISSSIARPFMSTFSSADSSISQPRHIPRTSEQDLALWHVSPFFSGITTQRASTSYQTPTSSPIPNNPLPKISETKAFMRSYSTPITVSSQSRVLSKTMPTGSTSQNTVRTESNPQFTRTSTFLDGKIKTGTGTVSQTSLSTPKKTSLPRQVGCPLMSEPLALKPLTRTYTAPDNASIWQPGLDHSQSSCESKAAMRLYSTNDFVSPPKNSTLDVKPSTKNWSTANYASSESSQKKTDSSVETYTLRRIKQKPMFDEDEDTRDSGCVDLDEEDYDDENESNPFLQTDFSMMF